MAPKQDAPVKKILLGRPSNNVKMGIVGLPNVSGGRFWALKTCEFPTPGSHGSDPPPVPSRSPSSPVLQVGKSTFFNMLCNMHVAAENYPFCSECAREPPPSRRGAARGARLTAPSIFPSSPQQSTRTCPR